MICVSIARKRHRFVLAEHKHLGEAGVKLVEIRLDYLQTRMDIRRLMANRPTPIIATIRRECDGGLYKGAENARLMLLRSVIAEGVDYIDLEDGVAGSIPRYGSTKRIVSYHNFSETPENLDEIFERMAKQDPDVIKIATKANTPEDNLRMLELVEKKKDVLPLVGFCMGDMGIPSRILCPAYGSPFTFACVDEQSVVAPGQIPYQTLRDLYRVERIGRDVKVYGVIADPVGHSLSPLIHNSAFAHKGMDDRVYLPFRVPKDHLNAFLEKAPSALNLRGLSVTIPHKEAVIPKLDEQDTSVRVIGACNTMLWEEGKCLGTNTDYQAAMNAFAEVLNADIPQHIDWVEPNDDPETGASKTSPLSGRTAILLGAGGVGRALGMGLARRGASLIYTDIDLPRAEKLAAQIAEEGFSVKAIPWEQRHFTNATLVVNCTPIGMFPKVNDTPFDGSFLRPNMVLFDAVYNPENTLFVKQGREHGCAVVTGLSMFAGQAALQFKRFTNTEPPVELMKDVVKKATQPAAW
ncbi:MAG: type I 3-dehydroquinate dehydratase [Planctomycetia bacterium]|nr:type I 3-dehydroquinate dehydratase [Planctomycetia bacterium]